MVHQYVEPVIKCDPTVLGMMNTTVVSYLLAAIHCLTSRKSTYKRYPLISKKQFTMGGRSVSGGGGDRKIALFVFRNN
jgi:hypothetical protein